MLDPRKQGKPEEMSEEMQQLQKENEKKLRDKRLLPAAKHNCITGILELIMHEYPYKVVCVSQNLHENSPSL